MGGIIFGGILGAAAAMYFNRTNRTISFAGMSSAGRTIDNMVEKARSRMMAPDKRLPQDAAGATESGLNQVENIVRQDPALQSEVNEIMNENRNRSAT